MVLTQFHGSHQAWQALRGLYYVWMWPNSAVADTRLGRKLSGHKLPCSGDEMIRVFRPRLYAFDWSDVGAGWAPRTVPGRASHIGASDPRTERVEVEGIGRRHGSSSIRSKPGLVTFRQSGLRLRS